MLKWVPQKIQLLKSIVYGKCVQFSTKRLLGRIIFNRDQDHETAALLIRLGISQSLSYYTFLEAMGLDEHYAHEIKFDQLFFLWYQSMSLSDDVVANFGDM